MPVKVECESCKAPYTIDERRIPAAGLRVRCPKCTKTFVVKKPEDAAGPATKPATPAATVAGGQSLADLPAQAPPPTPPSALPPSRDDADLPAVASKDVDLPAVAAKDAALPAVAAKDAALPAVKATPPKKPVIKGTALGLGGLVPGVVSAAGAQGKPTEAELPAVRAAATAPGFGGAQRPLPKPTEPELPAVRGDDGGFGDLDLPAPAAPKPVGRSLDVDLPSPAAAKPPAPPRPHEKTRTGLADLPAPAAPKADLPAVRADLPAVRADLPATRDDLPAQRADLPAQKADLPAMRAPAPAKSTQMEFGEVDLPAVGGPADLPAQRRVTQPFGEVDLPTVGSHLPAVRSPHADLPDLAAPGAHLPAIAATAANLPAVRGGGIDVSPREPSVAMPHPGDFGRDFAVAQTLVGPGVQPSTPDTSGFGELELPGPGAPSADPWGAPSPDLGLRSGTARGFGEIDLGGDALGPSPRAATGVDASGVNAPSLAPPMGAPHGGASDFGELELPGPQSSGGGLGASPSADTYGGNTGGVSFDSYVPPAGGDIATDLGAKIDSRATGGMGFGEVDLSGGSTDDALEFGAIPEERREGAGHEPAAYEAPVPKPREAKQETPAVEVEKKPSKIGRVFLGLFIAAVIGGALLQFDERLGAFGWKAISDKVNADKYAGMLTRAVSRTREGFGEDSLPRANDAVTELQKDVAAAPRYSPLIAYASYAQFAHELRFGKDPQRDSLARSSLARAVPGPHRTLAEAARHAVAGQFPGARAALKSLTTQDAKDVDAWVTLGELELAAKQPKDAIAAFEGAIRARDDARTRGGLMRAYEAAGELDKAKAEASKIAAKYPNHAGSRVLLAQYAWGHDKDEVEAMKWLSELEKPSVVASAAQNEQVEAMTLRGNIHLDRGRVSSAKKAFEDAIAAAKGTPVPAPRLGLGEVNLANGQYPQAISEFSLAAQAAPESALPKIGMARAYLKQEKPTEAKAQLSKVNDPKLAGDIGYYLGQAEEKLSPDRPSEAMKIYEAAIKAQPSEVKPYIALANLQAKIGKLDEADATLAAAAKNVPPSERLHLGVGELRFRQERYADALDHFNKALELQPSNLEALFSKGKTLLRMGERAKLDEGKKVLDEVRSKDEKYPGLALEYGLYYQKTDQIDEALKQYQTALARDPNDVDIQLSVARAQVEAHIRDAETALINILTKCTSSVSPDSCTSEANHYLGRAILDRGESAAAKPYLEAAVSKGDNNAQYHLYYGWALIEQNALVDAERAIGRALELDKSLGLAHWLRAEVEAKSGRYKEAIDSAKRALSLTPSLAQAHATIAFAHKQLNQEDAALAAYALAIKGDPTNPRAAFWRFQLADIHFHKNSIGRAVNELKDSIKQAKGFVAPPAWLPKAHFYLAEALRHSDRAEALKHYREYLATSIGSTDPARKEAQAAVLELSGKP